MTDIVERLRAYRMDVDSPDVVYEAADEIERLRAREHVAPEVKERFARLSAQRDRLRAAVDAAFALVVKYAEPGRRRKQLAGAVPVEELHRALDMTEERGDG